MWQKNTSNAALMVLASWLIFRHFPRVCNFIFLLICVGALFMDSDLSDTDNIVPFENTTPINKNKRAK